ncbi:hypothetical protein U1Q18_033012, partial [Sarracenia purpurea var. burkii]
CCREFLYCCFFWSRSHIAVKLLGVEFLSFAAELLKPLLQSFAAEFYWLVFSFCCCTSMIHSGFLMAVPLLAGVSFSSGVPSSFGSLFCGIFVAAVKDPLKPIGVRA